MHAYIVYDISPPMDMLQAGARCERASKVLAVAHALPGHDNDVSSYYYNYNNRDYYYTVIGITTTAAAAVAATAAAATTTTTTTTTSSSFAFHGSGVTCAFAKTRVSVCR